MKTTLQPTQWAKDNKILIEMAMEHAHHMGDASQFAAMIVNDFLAAERRENEQLSTHSSANGLSVSGLLHSEGA